MKSAEQQIKDYIIDNNLQTIEVVNNSQLYYLLSLIEMKDITKYVKFKLLLRNEGWII